MKVTASTPPVDDGLDEAPSGPEIFGKLPLVHGHRSDLCARPLEFGDERQVVGSMELDDYPGAAHAALAQEGGHLVEPLGLGFSIGFDAGDAQRGHRLGSSGDDVGLAASQPQIVDQSPGLRGFEPRADSDPGVGDQDVGGLGHEVAGEQLEV
ncbi:MAG TPA: hypothetical protein VI916_13380 [Acidimicrobiia bacterium]|nr:hypothetical protein [Acidimicrobiia bacterium]